MSVMALYVDSSIRNGKMTSSVLGRSKDSDGIISKKKSKYDTRSYCSVDDRIKDVKLNSDTRVVSSDR